MVDEGSTRLIERWHQHETSMVIEWRVKPTLPLPKRLNVSTSNSAERLVRAVKIILCVEATNGA